MTKTLKLAVPALLAALALGGASPPVGAAAQDAVLVPINEADYPGAKCNDDTQATYYLRGAAADGSVSGRKWLIFLHGGGSCKSPAGCAERWYDRTAGNDGIIGSHINMTAATRPTEPFDGKGILDFDGTDQWTVPGSNPFAGFNRIMIPYCSSDSYTGRNIVSRPFDSSAYLNQPFTADGQTITITNPSPAMPALTSLRFAGRTIVESVVDLLMRGRITTGNKLSPTAPNEPSQPASAEDEVVIAGSSAGGFGVIRNLDNMAAIVHGKAPQVKVYGVIDAADAVGAVTDASITGDQDFDNSSFYGATGVTEADLTCQGEFTLLASHKCFSPVFVLKNYVETPHFVVQQSYDGVIHGGLKQAGAAELALSVPAALAEPLSEQYIRNRISAGATQLGGAVTNPQHVGWFIPNYISSHHQLMVEDAWFFNSPLAFTTYGAIDLRLENPRLGTDMTSTMGIPRALACFRFKVTGQGSGCVDPGDAKFINSTFPTNPLTAAYDPATSTLTLPYVRLSNNTILRNVSVTLNPLGAVIVNDPTVNGPGSLNEYDIARNIIKLPVVTVGGQTYERVSATGAGIRVISYEPVPF